MKFYTNQHKYYCGIDLHTQKMYVCILDAAGEVRVHKNIKTNRDVFLQVIEPYREDVVVSVERMFTWYWISRSMCQRGASFRAWSCIIYESHSWRKSKKR